MDVLIWIAAGLAAGRLAQYWLNDDWHNATVNNLVAGVVGAVIAGWILRMTGYAGVTGVNVWVPFAAVAGAALALWAGRAFTSTPTLQ